MSYSRATSSGPMPGLRWSSGVSIGPGLTRLRRILRGNPTFECAVGKHDWLTRHVFVGVGERRSDGNLLRYYALV